MPKEKEAAAAKPATAKPAQIKKKSMFSNLFLSLLLLVAGLLSASYLTTETLDFGGQFKKLKNIYSEKVGVQHDLMKVFLVLMKRYQISYITKR